MNKIILALVLVLSMLGTGLADVEKDPAPVNFDPGMIVVWTEQRHFDASVGWNQPAGSYLMLCPGIKLGGYLASYDDIISVIAIHKDTGYRFSLKPSRCYFFLANQLRQHLLMLWDPGWASQGTWRFRLDYNGTDGMQHKQIYKYVMGDTTYVCPVSHVRFYDSPEGLIVSWSGMGDPSASGVDYRVRIYDENRCVFAEERGMWSGGTGWYDLVRNEVNFNVSAYSGMIIRLENRVMIPRPEGPPPQMNRAVLYVVVP